MQCRGRTLGTHLWLTLRGYNSPADDFDMDPALIAQLLDQSWDERLMPAVDRHTYIH